MYLEHAALVAGHGIHADVVELQHQLPHPLRPETG